MRHWRNLLVVALVAVLSFGGSFTCTSDHDDDGKVDGFVHVNP